MVSILIVSRPDSAATSARGLTSASFLGHHGMLLPKQPILIFETNLLSHLKHSYLGFIFQLLTNVNTVHFYLDGTIRKLITPYNVLLAAGCDHGHAQPAPEEAPLGAHREKSQLQV